MRNSWDTYRKEKVEIKTITMLKYLIILTLFLAPLAHAEEVPQDLYYFKVQTLDGEEKDLSEYKGKTILIVNTASFCGYTPQYKTLEELYQKYKSEGFLILGFPANNFKNQEPGSNAEIKEFCELKYKVTFPMFSKISVKGEDMHPLYRYLTTQSQRPGEITWNFNKFLVAPDGSVAHRFESHTDPMSEEIIKAVEGNLPDNFYR